MKIELAKLEDYDAINVLAVKLHDIHVDWRPDIFVHVDTMFDKNELEEMIKNKFIYVAKIDEKVVGYIIIGAIKEITNYGYKYRKELTIDAMIVDETKRGQSVGTKLLEFAISLAKEKNCTGIRLTVNEENEIAKHLYEKIGMKTRNISYTLDFNKNI